MTPVTEATTWADVCRQVADRLGSTREARWIIEEVTGTADPPAAAEPTDRARRRVADLTERRAAGEPLQYVLGRWGFRKLDLMVDRRVLIPRPETEQVTEVALEELRRLGRGQKEAVDLGTGSGAIALSLVAECKNVHVWATDRSSAAIEVATANLAGLGGEPATRVSMANGCWWAALPSHLRGHIDVAVSNPPYISSAEMGGLEPSVKDWEPWEALEAGPSGLEAIEEILDGAAGWLAPAGAVVLEMAPHQADGATAAARRSGFGDVCVRPDLAGRPRALVARR